MFIIVYYCQTRICHQMTNIYIGNMKRRHNFLVTWWKNIQGVSAKTFEPNNSVIFQRIFVKFKMQIF
jgi:hypothetical protein